MHQLHNHVRLIKHLITIELNEWLDDAGTNHVDTRPLALLNGSLVSTAGIAHGRRWDESALFGRSFETPCMDER
jgi:hypothetical protein